MTLVDSSVWIDWLRGEIESPPVMLLSALMAQRTAVLCPVVLQEILQGAANPAQYTKLRARFGRLPILAPEDMAVLHADAADLYAKTRWRGFTIRSPNDCVVAATAVQMGVPLLQDDIDFVRIAEVEPRLMLVAA